jgi:hypothetical protein
MTRHFHATFDGEVLEMTKIECRPGVDGRWYWCVMSLSPVHGRWITHSEHRNREDAVRDMANWR